MRRIELPGGLAHTAFSVADARALGVSRDRLRNPELAHPHHSVYADGLDDYELLDRCSALAPTLSVGQIFSHLTAARLYGMPLPRAYRHDEPLHLLTLRDAAPMRRPGVIGWETERSLRIARLDSVVVPDPAVVWSQLSVPGAIAPKQALSVAWLVAVADFLVTGARTDHGRALPLCTIGELRVARFAHAGRRGATALATALPLVRPGADSPKETELRLGLIAHGLPEPVVQLPVRTRSGVRHADLGYPEQRLLLEYQGDEHRTSRRRWLRDLTRIQLFEDVGYRTILVGADDLDDGCRAVAGRVRRALADPRDFTDGGRMRRVGPRM